MEAGSGDAHRTRQSAGSSSLTFFEVAPAERLLRESAVYCASAWPGTVLRATGGDVELRGLLADCDDDDLRELLGTGAQPIPRRRLRPQLVSVRR
jgi:hypothetical protein